MDSFLIYGVTGYTGKLIAELAAQKGLKPIVAGRDKEKVTAIAEKLNLPARVFSLEDPEKVARNLQGVKAVLHCAGPFTETSSRMLNGCVRARVHYLDITGEIDVFEEAHARHNEFKEVGITVIPGVGFDVVPSDCLAATLKSKLPDANCLKLAFATNGAISPGTAKTMVKNLDKAGAVRKDGKIVPVPAAYKTLDISYDKSPQLSVTIPWGDVATAYYSTNIPNIEVYTGATKNLVRGMKASNYLSKILMSRPVQKCLEKYIDKNVQGPSEEMRTRAYTQFWGEVSNPKGQKVTMKLRTPEGYALTAATALRATEEILKNPPGPGYFTPSVAFGKDFILGFDGVSLQ